ncbi:recombination protein RecR [Candidatus Jorgensenbacteria bacterium]|nr:recombination protein RecR [Candidatus Jorgensenbacteria bacterium]
MVPEPIKKFIEAFSRLPSIGPRLATRLAFYLAHLDRTTFAELTKAWAGLTHLDRCEQCFSLKDIKLKLCNICSDPQRNKTIIAIIEKETDMLSIERTGQFKCNYLILGELGDRGSLESNQKLRLEHLKKRILKDFGGKIKEIVVALNPNTFGDFAAEIIKQEFKSLAEKITRLGRGIPTGGEIEFADEETLGSALERRN